MEIRASPSLCSLLGSDAEVKWAMTEKGLEITPPEDRG